MIMSEPNGKIPSEKGKKRNDCENYIRPIRMCNKTFSHYSTV